MTGTEIYKKALMLTGTDTEGESLPECALDEINGIGDDLCGFKRLESIFETVEAKKETVDALPYGVAMLIAFKNGDSSRHAVLCELYNAKRAAAKYQSGKIRDILPNVSEGEI